MPQSVQVCMRGEAREGSASRQPTHPAAARDHLMGARRKRAIDQVRRGPAQRPDSRRILLLSEYLRLTGVGAPL